jgi:hypothetical protein
MMRGWSKLMAVFAVLAVPVLSCCDDDGDARDSGTSGRDSGQSPSDEGTEGWPCRGQNECIDDLRCNASPIVVGGVEVGVCGAPCSSNQQCGDRLCLSYSGREADGHCVDIVNEEYELCGVADTSVCSNDLVCLYLPNLPVGVCVRLCALDGEAGEAGEDAGVSVGGCSAGRTCIDGVIADGEAGEGVCGTLVERGEPCGIDSGFYCREEDVCAFENPRDPSAAPRCLRR